jgi:hypothetical protein
MPHIPSHAARAAAHAGLRLQAAEEPAAGGPQAPAPSAPRWSEPLDFEGVPNRFVCPITHDVMLDPVVASSGWTFERAVLQALLRQPSPTCPISRARLSQVYLENMALRADLRAFLELNPALGPQLSARQLEARNLAQQAGIPHHTATAAIAAVDLSEDASVAELLQALLRQCLGPVPAQLRPPSDYDPFGGAMYPRFGG